MSLLQLYPSEIIDLQREKQRQSVRIVNICYSTVAFKVQATSPKAFLVNPSYGLLQAHQETSITIALSSLEDGEAKEHKLQILAIQVNAKNYSLVNWEGVEAQCYRLFTWKPAELRNPTETMVKQISGDIGNLEDEKKGLVTRSIDLISTNIAVKDEIDKMGYQLRYFANYNQMLRHKTRQGFTVTILAIAFVVGFTISYFLSVVQVNISL